MDYIAAHVYIAARVHIAVGLHNTDVALPPSESSIFYAADDDLKLRITTELRTLQ